MKNYRIYKPNNNGNGAASEWQLSFKKDNVYNQWIFFLIVAKQDGKDDKDNSKFNWKDGALIVKLGETDLGEILCVLDGVKGSLGTKGSLFHQTPNGANKIIKLDANDHGGFNLTVSAQDEQKNKVGPYYHSITAAEGKLLSIYIKKALELIFYG